MEIASAVLLLSTLSITPDRSQFFFYEKIVLKCATPPNSGTWTVRRNTTKWTSQACQFGWAIPGDSSCTVEAPNEKETGVYWCQSEQGEQSNTINITVTNGVILYSPSFPVMEGQKVTLGCSYKDRTDPDSTSDFSASFYRDDVFIGNDKNIVFESVSKSDEGFYMCEHPSKGKSEPTWLSVTARTKPSVAPTPLVQTQDESIQFDIGILVGGVLLLILYIILTVVSVHIHRKLARVRAYVKMRAASHDAEE